MIWSISESKTLRRCPRQWYFKNIVASATAKDEYRREAYLLGKLQSISQWRGNVVDDAISYLLIPALNQGRRVTLGDLQRYAEKLFDQQLECAKAHRLREPGISVTKDALFAAFHCMEYGGGIPGDEVERAREEVLTALKNLFELDQVKTVLKSATYRIAQRALSFSHSDMTVRSVPDVIAFNDSQPPVIVDWKVHVFGRQEAWLQLGTYALALASVKPHKDFPAVSDPWRAEDIPLLEIQLLARVVREHRVTTDSIQDIHDYIANSVSSIALLLDSRKRGALSAEDFPVTGDPDVCQRCSYRRICWDKEVL